MKPTPKLPNPMPQSCKNKSRKPVSCWCSGFRVYGLDFRVWGLGFRVEGLEFRVWGIGLRLILVYWFQYMEKVKNDANSEFMCCSDF